MKLHNLVEATFLKNVLSLVPYHNHIVALRVTYDKALTCIVDTGKIQSALHQLILFAVYNKSSYHGHTSDTLSLPIKIESISCDLGGGGATL